MSERKARSWRINTGVEKQNASPARGEVIGTYCDGSAIVAQAAFGPAAAAFHDECLRRGRVLRPTTLRHLSLGFEEGGLKSSGLDQLGGPASMKEVLEYKQITQNCASAH